MNILQAMDKCGPEGRDCIERHSSLVFNCSVTCEGIFADTDHFAVDKTGGKMRGGFGQNETELNEKKLKALHQYQQKEENVRRLKQVKGVQEEGFPPQHLLL